MNRMMTTRQIDLIVWALFFAIATAAVYLI